MLLLLMLLLPWTFPNLLVQVNSLRPLDCNAHSLCLTHFSCNTPPPPPVEHRCSKRYTLCVYRSNSSCSATNPCRATTSTPSSSSSSPPSIASPSPRHLRMVSSDPSPSSSSLSKCAAPVVILSKAEFQSEAQGSTQAPNSTPSPTNSSGIITLLGNCRVQRTLLGARHPPGRMGGFPLWLCTSPPERMSLLSNNIFCALRCLLRKHS